MPTDFKLIYKILKILQKSMDLSYYDPSKLSAEALGISECRRNALLIMLQRKGYITGVSVMQYIGDNKPEVDINSQIEITLDGLEYLSENNLMKKAARYLGDTIELLK